jgi:hypothetical protein
MEVEMHGCWYELPWYVKGYTYSVADGHNRIDFRLTWPLRLVVWLCHITGIRKTGTLKRARPLPRPTLPRYGSEQIETYRRRAQRRSWLW